MCAKKNNHSSLLKIDVKDEKLLSPEQKRFNRRVAEVEKMKKKVEKAKNQFQELKVMMAAEVEPMEGKLNDARVKIVEQFDYWCENPKGFTKKERRLLKEVLLEKAEELIGAGYDELIPIFDKYSDTAYDDIWQSEVQDLKEMIQGEAKDAFGVDLDLDENDFHSPEEFMRAMMREMEEKKGQIDDHYREQEKAEFEQKSKKQQEKVLEKKEEAKNISKAVKTAYNKLVKRYHPDRAENEEDLEVRNQAMHKITKAYKDNDLFELLRLQMELGDVKSEEMATMPAEQLDHYNKLLMDQIKELTEEYEFLKRPMPPFEHYEDYMRCRSTNGMKKRINSAVREIEMDLEEMEDTLAMLEHKQGTKSLLSAIESERKFQSEIFDILNGFGGFSDKDSF